MIGGTNPNGQIPATTNDEKTIPAGSKAQPSYIYAHAACVYVNRLYMFKNLPDGMNKFWITVYCTYMDFVPIPGFLLGFSLSSLPVLGPP